MCRVGVSAMCVCVRECACICMCVTTGPGSNKITQLKVTDTQRQCLKMSCTAQ